MFLERLHEAEGRRGRRRSHHAPARPLVTAFGAVAAALGALFAVGVMVGAWWDGQRACTDACNAKAVTETSAGSNQADGPVANSSLADADRDGLTDDLEALYGTHPALADTDGDGFDDGTEVAHGYEPLNPTPGARLVDLALVSRLAADQPNAIVISTGRSTVDRQRYYIVYDGSSTSYYGADGALVAQCIPDVAAAGACAVLPNAIRTDYARSMTGGTQTDVFHLPF